MYMYMCMCIFIYVPIIVPRGSYVHGLATPMVPDPVTSEGLVRRLLRTCRFEPCRCALFALICVIGVVWAGSGPPV